MELAIAINLISWAHLLPYFSIDNSHESRIFFFRRNGRILWCTFGIAKAVQINFSAEPYHQYVQISRLTNSMFFFCIYKIYYSRLPSKTVAVLRPDQICINIFSFIFFYFQILSSCLFTEDAKNCMKIEEVRRKRP